MTITQNIASYVLITQASEVANLAVELNHQQEIAIDTESNSLYAYQERVCLLQISTHTTDYIIDPLATSQGRRLDLGALGAVFANPAVKKVFHACEYDILGLQRDFGFEMTNVFDTMLAARALGWKRIGLASLLEQSFGVQLQKKWQRANWGVRPLQAEQLEYARQDTHYLLSLCTQIEAALRNQQLMQELREETDRVVRNSLRSGALGKNVQPDPHAFWRANKQRDLSPQQAAVLQALFWFREQRAALQDCPPFKIMSDDVLCDLAIKQPKTLDDLAAIPSLSTGQLHRFGHQLLSAIRKGQNNPPPAPPPVMLPPEAVRLRYDSLHHWRRERAQQRGVESDVILPREVLWELAQRNPQTLLELAQTPELGAYRLQLYGNALLELLRQ
jgi:ribonuclease D